MKQLFCDSLTISAGAWLAISYHYVHEIPTFLLLFILPSVCAIYLAGQIRKSKGKIYIRTDAGRKIDLKARLKTNR